MRNRLVRSTLGIALVSVFALGLPLLLLARHQVWSTAHERLREQASTVASGLEDRLDAGEPVDPQPFARENPGRELLVEPRVGQPISAGPALTGRVLSASVVVSGSTVTVRAAREPTAEKARTATLLVIGLSSLAVAGAFGLALTQSRRLARPLADLASRADALGRGEFADKAMVTGVPEVDAIAAVLDRSGRQIGALLDVQREFAGDAAHQLRTPLTGIALRLEEITRIGDDASREEAEDALAQVERLDSVISALLARTRGEQVAPVALDLSELVTSEALSWQRVYAEQGRHIAVEAPAAVLVRARRDHVCGVLSCLLDNALEHGGGEVIVVVSEAGHLVRLSVQDHGTGVPVELADRVFDRSVSGARGTGIGLALARSLALADGGDLELEPDVRSRFVLTLPGAGAPA